MSEEEGETSEYSLPRSEHVDRDPVRERREDRVARQHRQSQHRSQVIGAIQETTTGGETQGNLKTVSVSLLTSTVTRRPIEWT